MGRILISVGIYHGKGVKGVHWKASPPTLHQEMNPDDKHSWSSVHSHFVCLEFTKIQPNFNPSEKKVEKEDWRATGLLHILYKK